MLDPRIISQRDRAAAMSRAERRKLLALSDDFCDDKWHTKIDNIETLLAYMVDQCDDLEEVRRVVKEIIAKPWHWHREFVIAKCLEFDKGTHKA